MLKIRYERATGDFFVTSSKGEIKTGSRAKKRGYRFVRIGTQNYLAHRVAWLLSYGKWPDGDVDHINRDKTDNRLSNLRLATRTQNNANRCKNIKKAGLKGAYRARSGRWVSKIRANGVKYFLGTFDTEQEAHEAYCAAAERHFGAFARAA